MNSVEKSNGPSKVNRREYKFVNEIKKIGVKSLLKMKSVQNLLDK